VKLVRLFGFIIKKFVTMHGHMNVKTECLPPSPFFFLSFCKIYLVNW